MRWRLLVLKKYGGIYLDNDIYVINKLDKYRHFEFVLGWPDGEWIGNMLLMGHKDARFITQFIDTYKNYRPDIWYYNGGEKPVREARNLFTFIIILYDTDDCIIIALLTARNQILL